MPVSDCGSVWALLPSWIGITSVKRGYRGGLRGYRDGPGGPGPAWAPTGGPDPDIPEASVGVLAVRTEGPAQIGLPGVGEPGQQLAVTGHGDLVADLDDADAVRDADPEQRGPARGEESLTARIGGSPAWTEASRWAPGSARRSCAVGGVVPDHPADLPRVRAPGHAAAQLADGLHPHVATKSA